MSWKSGAWWSSGFLTCVLLGCVPGGGGGDGGGGGSPGNGGPDGGLERDAGPAEMLDDRCVALCGSDEAACADEVDDCEALCGARVAGLTGLCRTCLLEDAYGGECEKDGPCCPYPFFPTSTLSCAESCAEQHDAAAPDPHPVCAVLCADDEVECAEDAEQCFAACSARVDGVSALCATCLLEEAYSGGCAGAGGGSGGGPCCPSFEPGRAAADCAAVCD